MNEKEKQEFFALFSRYIAEEMDKEEMTKTAVKKARKGRLRLPADPHYMVHHHRPVGDYLQEHLQGERLCR